MKNKVQEIQERIMQRHRQYLAQDTELRHVYTIKPVLRGHLLDKEKVAL